MRQETSSALTWSTISQWTMRVMIHHLFFYCQYLPVKFRHVGKPERQSDDSPLFAAEEVLSAERPDAAESDMTWRSAVPDTACGRTLVGAYTLQMLEQHLGNQGYRVVKRRGKSMEISFQIW